ncbi:MAG: efflux RND transporter periplasmic adaptor subunit [Planctomycetes bacterium]|jgi:RND family efflux transporter MFP subunit|nr:efflux RND transporter periplasmic adaptor subunit [Planctomycetota bacterium]
MAVDLNDLRIPKEGAGTSRRPILPWALLAIVVIGGGAGAAWFLRDRANAAEEGLPVATARPVWQAEGGGPSPRSFTAGGWVEPAYPWPVAVTALTPGRVDDLLVQEGDRVAEGQVVARLYDRDLRDEADRARAEHEAAKARLARLEAGTRKEDVEEGRARLEELEAEAALLRKVADRSRALAPDGVVSAEQAERDEAAAQAGGAKVRAQKAKVDLLVAGPRREEIAAARAEAARLAAEVALAEKRLGYVEVRAHVAGTVLRLLVEKGGRLGPEKPAVVSLFDPAALWVRVDVSQADIGKVRTDQPVEIRTLAEPDRGFSGRVVRVDPAADFAKNTITVRVRFDRTDGRLHPDMTARVHFLAEGKAPSAKGAAPSGRLLVPRTAVLSQGGASWVFVLAGGKAARLDVEVGGTLGDTVEIVRGLTPDARLIVSDLDRVKDGMKVSEK